MASPLLDIAGVNSLLFCLLRCRTPCCIPLSQAESPAGAMVGAANAVLASPDSTTSSVAGTPTTLSHGAPALLVAGSRHRRTHRRTRYPRAPCRALLGALSERLRETLRHPAPRRPACTEFSPSPPGVGAPPFPPPSSSHAPRAAAPPPRRHRRSTAPNTRSLSSSSSRAHHRTVTDREREMNIILSKITQQASRSAQDKDTCWFLPSETAAACGSGKIPLPNPCTRSQRPGLQHHVAIQAAIGFKRGHARQVSLAKGVATGHLRSRPFGYPIHRALHAPLVRANVPVHLQVVWIVVLYLLVVQRCRVGLTFSHLPCRSRARVERTHSVFGELKTRRLSFAQSPLCSAVFLFISPNLSAHSRSFDCASASPTSLSRSSRTRYASTSSPLPAALVLCSCGGELLDNYAPHHAPLQVSSRRRHRRVFGVERCGMAVDHVALKRSAGARSCDSYFDVQPLYISTSFMISDKLNFPAQRFNIASDENADKNEGGNSGACIQVSIWNVDGVEQLCSGKTHYAQRDWQLNANGPRK
ncbi:hypothetical protein FB451DRAFT_1179873 [Mycena latifolia]|nr:hypothetical protein FB451DRAFT_1179873 [Mycena latifolia]